jgi:hypothetical protein
MARINTKNKTFVITAFVILQTLLLNDCFASAGTIAKTQPVPVFTVDVPNLLLSSHDYLGASFAALVEYGLGDISQADLMLRFEESLNDLKKLKELISLTAKDSVIDNAMRITDTYELTDLYISTIEELKQKFSDIFKRANEEAISAIKADLTRFGAINYVRDHKKLKVGSASTQLFGNNKK